MKARKHIKGKYYQEKKRNIDYKKISIISAFVLVLSSIVLINSPKDNIFKSSYKKLLANNGIYTEEIKSIDITSDDYDEPGSFKVTKKAEWTDYGKAKLTITADSIIKEKNNNKKDIILVMDISGSMEGTKLDKAQEDAIDLTNKILEDEANQIGLITFDSNAEIVFNLTSDINAINDNINSLTTKGATNYNDALKKVDNMLENYQEQNNRDLIVLFLTDGNPCNDTPNEVSTYKILKEKYPSLTIQGIQYEMGSNITDSLKNISDNQFNASIDTLGNVLIEASTNPLAYNEFIITDFIDTDYFEDPNAEDIKTSFGSYELDGNKITWNLGDSYVTGNKASLTVNLTQKERYIEEEGFYSTNEKESIKYKLGEENETISSHDTPVLKNTYEVIYNTNAPVGCNVETPESEKQTINKVVTMKTTELSCEGYNFNGWEIENSQGIQYLNKNTFKMPLRNVYINATWSKQSINKTMDGTVYTKPTLYNVLKNEAKIGTYAKEYTGEHADAYDKTGTKKIYHYTTTSTNTNVANQQAEAILNRFNVIFGGFCWQILRTTDTGGVKLLYNGIPDSNGTCNNNGTAQQIGTSLFNKDNRSPSDVGYMYNKSYDIIHTKDLKITTTQENLLNTLSINLSMWYGHDVIYGTPSTGKYTLANPYRIEDVSDYPNLVGEYTINSTIETNTSYYAYRIVAVDGSIAYYISLYMNYDFDYFNDNYTYGDDYIYNDNDGTYTINNPTTINRSDWYSNYRKIENKYVCKNAINNSCSKLWYVTETNDTRLKYTIVNNYKFAKGFTYENDTYKLNDESVSFWDISDKKNVKKLNNAHYTCWNKSGECTTLSYIYFVENTKVWYMNLTDGKSVDDALTEMLYEDNVNSIDSTIKTYIDTWYKENLLDYSEDLEDTVFCNDRTIIEKNGWDSNGGNVENRNLVFKNNVLTNDLSCVKETDRFSTLNNKAKLTYPVALASVPEMNLLYSKIIRETGDNYWLGSPSVSNAHGENIRYIYGHGSFEEYAAYGVMGVRPVISLKPGIEYSDGDGSRDHPYIIDTEGD